MVSRFCNRCGQLLPANATTCPRCNAPVAQPSSATPGAAATPGPGATETPPSARRACANCRAPMRWIGHYSLRASGPPGSGGVSPEGGAEAAETLLPFSLYYCQNCGKFDFYYPGT
jgi:hypothetical protein